jgi:tetrapyrrole methylase family protein / MazG family protein
MHDPSLLPLWQAIQVVADLRHATHGCPWDLKQTHASLKRFLLEETQETLTAIDDNDPAALCEELGDVLLQVLLHAQIAQDNQQFTVADVAHTLAQKLVRRHPHVYAHGFVEPDVAINTPQQVTQQWQQIKAAEKKGHKGNNPGVLADVPKGLPALTRAYVTSQKAVAVGFEWPDVTSLWQCVMSEFDEFRAETDATHPDDGTRHNRLEDEFGDILFASINLGRQYGIDPEVALHRATDKFTRRFNTMETLVDKPLADLSEQLTFADWDALWNQAKQLNQPTRA